MLEEYGKEEEDETKRLYEEDNFCLKTIKVNTVILLLGLFCSKLFSHTLYYYDPPIFRPLSATAEVSKQVILEVILELPKKTTSLPRSARLQIINLPTMPSLQLAFWLKEVVYP